MAQAIDLGPVVGPNRISETTETNLSGILTADGATVGATEVLPVAKGGTGAADNVTALRNLGAKSNPNLLQNWDWRNPVNTPLFAQRATNGPLFDRWGLVGTNGAVSLTAQGLKFTSVEGSLAGIYQNLRETTLPFLVGEKVTFSLAENEGAISSGSGRLPEVGARTSILIDREFLYVHIDAITTNKYEILIGKNGGDPVTISAVKLELGSVSTLALDLDQPSDFRVQALKLTGRTGGMDLSRVMTAAELHSQITAGDFSRIHTGDYWPLTLNGSFVDYATGETKTLSNAVLNIELMPNFYSANYGDTAIGNHVLACSRDCLPIALQMRSANDVWYDDTATNPFLGSHLYQTLNASDGILALVELTELGQYLGNMRFYMETKPKGATTATAGAWGNRGKLFLPLEREVWGADVFSEHAYGGLGGALQWSIFAGSRRHISKGLGNSGAKSGWWCASSAVGSALNACAVTASGYPVSYGASGILGIPLCFIIK